MLDNPLLDNLSVTQTVLAGDCFQMSMNYENDNNWIGSRPNDEERLKKIKLRDNN